MGYEYHMCINNEGGNEVMKNLSNYLKDIYELPTNYFDKYLRRFFHPECKIEEEDFIIGSFPRSGRTWVRFFTAFYLQGAYSLDSKVTWNNFVQFTPGPLCNDDSGLMNFPLEGKTPKPIFSHNRHIGKFYSNRKVAYITRDFSDIVVSYYHYHANRGKEHWQNMELATFLRNEFDLDEAIDRINYFSKRLEHSEDYLVFPFEGLLNDTSAWFRKFIDFSPYDYQKEAFHYALESSRYENLHEKERKEKELKKNEAFHTRKGSKGEGKEKLSNSAREFLIERLNNELAGTLREYYIPGNPQKKLDEWTQSTLNADN